MKNDDGKLKEQQTLAPVSLLACPFCGARNAKLYKFKDKWEIIYRIKCFTCGAVGPGGLEINFAKRRWNERAGQANARTELPPPDTTVASKKNVQTKND